MKIKDSLILIIVGMFFGSSFLFMRVASGEFGPIPLITLRVGFGSLILLPLVIYKGYGPLIKSHFKYIYTIGLLNAALPFVLFSYSMLKLNAGYAALIDALAPMFGAFLGIIWLKHSVTLFRAAGLLLGFLGVVIWYGKTSRFPETHYPSLQR